MADPSEAALTMEQQSEKAGLEEKEKMPSIASGWPITLPALREKTAQFVPNWNSKGMPVTTPIAKLMAKMRAQKRSARS